MNSDALVCVAGWENRFAAGLKLDVDRYHPAEIVMIVFQEYKDETQASRSEVVSYAAEKGIVCRELSVHREPREVWDTLRSDFTSSTWSQKRVVLDISTMPREVIWWSLSFLMGVGCELRYVYHRPQSYSSEWLTRDTDRPRLVYQHSGIAKLGKPTALLRARP